MASKRLSRQQSRQPKIVVYSPMNRILKLNVEAKVKIPSTPTVRIQIALHRFVYCM